MAGLKRHMAAVERAMGVLLVAVGVLMLTGAFSDLSFWLLETFPALGADRVRLTRLRSTPIDTAPVQAAWMRR